MSNDYFNSTTYRMTAGTRARAGDVNDFLDGLEEGLDKLPSEANIKRGLINYAADTGAADAYAVTLTYAPAVYTDGMEVVFKASAVNTGASTINVNALGIKSITRQDGTALIAGDIPADKIVSIRYNSTSGNFELQSGLTGIAGTGTMASQNANAVAIVGGTISGVTASTTTLTSPVINTGVSGTAIKDEDNMASDSNTHLATQQSIKAYVDSGTVTMTNKTLTSPVLNTGVSGTAILDEDNMATDSNTHLATQQSIKAYVDSGTVTMTNKRLTSPKINEDVAVAATATEINTVADGATAKNSHTHTLADGGTDVIATATQINNKANSEAFVTNANGNPNVSDTQFLIAVNISSAWESIGPTGSGADNIWTALDSVPAGADWIEVRIEQTFQRTSGTDTGVYADIHARRNGSSEAHSLINKILALEGYGGTTVHVRASCTVTHKIPVSSRMFDLTYWAASYTSHGNWMRLIGYGYNP
jgi:hypothetical protein